MRERKMTTENERGQKKEKGGKEKRRLSQTRERQ